MKINRVCILGGSGFVGHHLACRLARRGIQCRIPSRHPQRHRDLEVLPGVRPVAADIFDPASLKAQFSGCDAVINLVGILNESGDEGGFRRAHVELVDRVVEACKAAGVTRLLHMSALNADRERGPSRYLSTKGEGENHAHGHPEIRVTSFRPSVIFGPGDSFFNRFAELLSLVPAPFPLACPDARFAPVYVGDVADAFIRALADPATWGRRYDLCGPRIFTLRELVRYSADNLGLARPIIGLGDSASILQARILERLPGQPFSYDNYLSLQVDSLCRHNGLIELGIEPADVDSIVPLYLGARSKQGRLARLRRLA